MRHHSPRTEIVAKALEGCDDDDDDDDDDSLLPVSHTNKSRRPRRPQEHDGGLSAWRQEGRLRCQQRGVALISTATITVKESLHRYWGLLPLLLGVAAVNQDHTW